MNEAMRTTRTTMSTTQLAEQCQPTMCANTGGRASFGAPTALNAAVSAAAFQHANNVTPNVGRAPFGVRTITKPASTILNILGQKFKVNACCWRCGFSKKCHSQLQVTFGKKCDHNCHRGDCSKCGERIKDCHPDQQHVGPLCAKEPCAGSPCCDWFLARVLLLLLLLRATCNLLTNSSYADAGESGTQWTLESLAKSTL